MDSFNECLVARPVKPLQWVLMGLLVILGGYIGFLCLVIPMVGPLILCGIIFGLYFLFRRNFVEYEYIFTNGDIDIDKITGKSRRKRQLSFNCSNIEMMAVLGDEKYRHNFEHGDFQKKQDFSSGVAGRKRYFAIVNAKEKGRQLIVFEPNEQMLEAIKHAAPRKVHELGA